jgi:hypothetical protein
MNKNASLKYYVISVFLMIYFSTPTLHIGLPRLNPVPGFWSLFSSYNFYPHKIQVRPSGDPLSFFRFFGAVALKKIRCFLYFAPFIVFLHSHKSELELSG